MVGVERRSHNFLFEHFQERNADAHPSTEQQRRTLISGCTRQLLFQDEFRIREKPQEHATFSSSIRRLPFPIPIGIVVFHQLADDFLVLAYDRLLGKLDNALDQIIDEGLNAFIRLVIAANR